MKIFANPDDEPRIWGEDPDWDARMQQYQAELAEDRRLQHESNHRDEAIRRTIDEVLEEARPPFNTEMLRRRLRQEFGLPSEP